MKIIKDKKTSLLLKSFLINNQDHLCISVLYYFDLNNPEAPLDEQAMYKEVPKVLGKTLLDAAMAKPTAEVLLCGSCYNDRPETGASHVRLEVGSINKELYVFGERRWKNGGITKPLPFKSMPLDLAHAQVHDDYLPNIEDPDNLTVHKNSTTPPAGFMPLDITSPENMKKLGTYNAAWKNELWPGFAADMDYSFFNVAPKDQQLEQFFEGGEQITLLNMHPEKKLLTSAIPQSGFRCFVSKAHKEKEDAFKEVILRRDTLWLFPEIQRGVVIFRGTVAVEDEIYSDLKYLNLKPLEADAPHKSLEAYYALQQKELERSVPAETPDMSEHNAAIAEAKKEIFDMPRSTREQVQKSQGKRATLKRTPAEKLERAHANIDAGIARIDAAKLRLQERKEVSGHISKVDLAPLDEAKAKLLASKGKLTKSKDDIEQLLKENKQMKIDALADIEAIKKDPKIPDEAKEQMEFDFLQEKEKVWSDYALEFATVCVKSREKNAEVLHKLRHLGLAQRTQQRAWIGYHDEETSLDAEAWKLKEKEPIILPKGLVTVRFEEATVKSLRIGKHLVLGSDAGYELFLSEGNANFPLFFFKDDDLQAHLCDQEAYDICNTLCCDDVSSVGDEAKKALDEASVIFYLQEDGVIEKLPQAKVFDCGEYKDLFELHQNGVEIRDQLIENLPDNIEEHLPLERDTSPAAINKQVKAIMDAEKVKFTTKMAAVKEEMEAERDAAIEKANVTLKKYGQEPIDLSAASPSPSADFAMSAEVEKAFDQAIATLKTKNAQYGLNIDEKIAELQQGKEETLALAKKGEGQFAEGMEKIAKVKEWAKDPTPQWAKEMMLKAGIDPENPFEKELTREDVIALHAEGKSLAKKNLTGLDLSALDLSGIDLTQANLNKTDFSKTDLSGAKLDGANCSESNFTKAKLSQVSATQCMFTKTIFEESLCEEFRADKAFFNAALFKKTQGSKASFEAASFQEVEMEESTFTDSNFSKNSFSKSTLQKCDFSGTQMTKATFSGCELTDCSFQALDAKAMLFNKTKLTKCDLGNAELYNMRLLKESAMYECDLSGSNMKKSTIFEAKLEGCKLQQVIIDKSLIKKSLLAKCDFRGASAKGTRFEYAAATASTFAGINLLGGSLRRMDLKACDFSYANLYGVEFYKAKVYEVKFEGANLKRSGLENRVEFIDD